MFKIAEVIRLLTRIFVKQNKRFPKGLEGVDIRIKAKKIHDVGKANNYQGGISEDQLKQFLAWEKQAPITKEVSKDILKVPKKKGEVIEVDFDPGGKRTFITEAEKKAELDKALGPPDEVFGSPVKDWHMKEFKKPGAKDVTPDLSKYDDASLNTLAEEGNRIKVRLKELGESGVNYGEFRKLEGRLKEIDDILSAAQDVPPSGYDNFKADLSLNKQTEAQIKARIEKQNKESIQRLKDKMKDKDPEDFAGGGRTGTGLNYLLGEDDQNMRVPFGVGGFNAARRAFLKWLGAGAATAGVAKSGLFSLLKSGKPVVKELTSVPIKNISGMPPWFKPLVNQIIKKGDEVQSGAERVIVHKSKLPNSKTDLYVTQELDTGNVMVDIGVTKHGFPDGHLGQPVRLEYKAAEMLEGPIKKGKPTKTKDEFWVDEAEFTGGHPENVKFEETVSSKFGEHGSNFDEVEKFATGTVKKIKKASGGRVPLGVGGLAGLLGE